MTRHPKSLVQSSPSADAFATPSMHEPKVIVIVGREGLQLRIGSRLRADDFAVMHAQTDDELEHIVKERIPAAILLGLTPGDDPYFLVRRLRCHERLAFVQVIIVSVGAKTLQMSQALRAGADDVVAGSVEPIDEVADRIVARLDRFQALAQLAALDPLTGLLNRRLMNDQLTAEIARAGRAGTKLSVAVVDLDDFKRINDVYGHATGDRTLTAFAQAFRRGLRGYDMTYRYGGDEFVVLLSGCDANGARAALLQLREEFGLMASDLPALTFSAGIAEFPRDGVSWKDLFDVADRNVRRAKSERHPCAVSVELRVAFPCSPSANGNVCHSNDGGPILTTLSGGQTVCCSGPEV
ncbi:MAG TPA: diguanylate cyclase response regulator [Polyangiaceae bacterium]|jgi:diguanylate cyclase (GGDEF)-like protein